MWPRRFLIYNEFHIYLILNHFIQQNLTKSDAFVTKFSTFYLNPWNPLNFRLPFGVWVTIGWSISLQYGTSAIGIIERSSIIWFINWSSGITGMNNWCSNCFDNRSSISGLNYGCNNRFNIMSWGMDLGNWLMWNSGRHRLYNMTNSGIGRLMIIRGNCIVCRWWSQISRAGSSNGN